MNQRPRLQRSEISYGCIELTINEPEIGIGSDADKTQQIDNDPTIRVDSVDVAASDRMHGPGQCQFGSRPATGRGGGGDQYAAPSHAARALSSFDRPAPAAPPPDRQTNPQRKSTS